VDGVKFRCPCINCLKGRRLDATQIRKHLLCDEFGPNYTTCAWHGEWLDLPSMCPNQEFVDSTINNQLKNIIRGIEVESFVQAHIYETCWVI